MEYETIRFISQNDCGYGDSRTLIGIGHLDKEATHFVVQTREWDKIIDEWRKCIETNTDVELSIRCENIKMSNYSIYSPRNSDPRALWSISDDYTNYTNIQTGTCVIKSSDNNIEISILGIDSVPIRVYRNIKCTTEHENRNYGYNCIIDRLFIDYENRNLRWKLQSVNKKIRPPMISAKKLSDLRSKKLIGVIVGMDLIKVPSDCTKMRLVCYYRSTNIACENHLKYFDIDLSLNDLRSVATSALPELQSHKPVSCNVECTDSAIYGKCIFTLSKTQFKLERRGFFNDAFIAYGKMLTQIYALLRSVGANTEQLKIKEGNFV